MSTVTNQPSPLVDIDGDGLLEVVAAYDGIDLANNPIRLDPVEIGQGASTVDGATAVGVNALTDDQNSAAFGSGAEALGRDATALGTESQAPANWNTAVGYDAGSAQNGENVVIVGRKAEAQGNNAVAVGEIARATGNRATAVGRGADALAVNASAFGQGVVASAIDASAYGQGSAATAEAATAFGQGAVADAPNATALGVDATATADGALALGRDTTVAQVNTFGFGPRDFEIDAGNTVVYPVGTGQQVLVDKPQDGSQPAGDPIGYQLAIAGTTIAEMYAESDGAGDVQNPRLDIPVNLTVDGQTTQVDDVVTADITIEDGGGVEQFRFDATADPKVADFHDNRVSNFGLKAGETLTYPNGAASQTFIDKVQDGTQAAGTPVGYSFDVAGTSIAEMYAESDGAGGTQNQRVVLADSDLRLGVGRVVADTTGSARLGIQQSQTNLRDEDGDTRFVADADGRVGPNVGGPTPYTIFDTEGGFTGVRYDPGANTGLLRTPGAGVRVEDRATPNTGAGLEIGYEAETARLLPYDRDTGTYKPLGINADLVDLSYGGSTTNLRLDTNRAIEDGAGNARLRLQDNETRLLAGRGNSLPRVGVQEGAYIQEVVTAGEIWKIRDEVGSTNAVTYTPGSTRGTFDLRHAQLKSTDPALGRFIVREVDSTQAGNTKMSFVDVANNNPTIFWERNFTDNSAFRLYNSALGSVLLDITENSGMRVGNGDGSGEIVTWKDGSAEGGAVRGQVSESGDVTIEGQLTEGAAL